jgi:hypothetical protein
VHAWSAKPQNEAAPAALHQNHKNKCTRQCTAALLLFFFFFFFFFTREWE